MHLEAGSPKNERFDVVRMEHDRLREKMWETIGKLRPSQQTVRQCDFRTLASA